VQKWIKETRRDRRLCTRLRSTVMWSVAWLRLIMVLMLILSISLSPPFFLCSLLLSPPFILLLFSFSPSLLLLFSFYSPSPLSLLLRFSFSFSPPFSSFSPSSSSSPYIIIRDGRQSTPLHLAAANGFTDCVEFLLENKYAKRGEQEREREGEREKRCVRG
jgi:ankyrin repeat protein